MDFEGAAVEVAPVDPDGGRDDNPFGWVVVVDEPNGFFVAADDDDDGGRDDDDDEDDDDEVFEAPEVGRLPLGRSPVLGGMDIQNSICGASEPGSGTPKEERGKERKEDFCISQNQGV